MSILEQLGSMARPARYPNRTRHRFTLWHVRLAILSTMAGQARKV